MKKKNIKILIATHKQYKMPNNEIYVPLHVGAEGKQDLGYLKDNTKDNISKKNPNYCELTGLYWAWKNLKCDIIGLAHYRRYFTAKEQISKITVDNFEKYILDEDEINDILKTNDIIVSKYSTFFKNNRNFYKEIHHIEDLDITREVLKEKYPEYLECFDRRMKSHKLSICNMFVMKKKIFDEYCDWLFDILFEVEKRTDIENYTTHQKRIYGFLSERLLNVWLDKHNELRIRHLKIISLEHDSLKVLIPKAIKRLFHIKK